MGKPLMKLTANRVNLFAYLSLVISLVFLAVLTLLRGAAQYNNLGVICLIVGILFFLVIDRARTLSSGRASNVQTPPSSFLGVQQLPLLAALYSVLIIVGGLSLVLRSGIDRPALFFVVIAALYAVIALEIIAFAGQRHSQGLIFFVLSQIVSVTLLLQSSYFIDVYQYTDDPGTHRTLAEAIITTGHTTPLFDLTHYGQAYLFHVYYAIASIVPNIDILRVSLIIGAVQCMSILLLYLLARKFTKNITASLFSALLFSFFALYIEYAEVQTTLGLALVLVLFVMLCVVAIYLPSKTSGAKSSGVYLSLGLLSFAALLLTHPEFSFACLLWVLLFAVSVAVYRRVQRPTWGAMRAPLMVALIFLALWLFMQLYTSNGPYLLYDVQSLLGSVGNFGSDLASVGSQGGVVPPVSSYVSFFFANIGLLLFYSLITAGCFLLLKSKNEAHIILALWAGLNFLFIIVGLALGEVAVLFSRFYYFVGPIAAILGGYVIITFLDTARANKHRALRVTLVSGLCLLLFASSLLSVASERSDLLDPVFHQSPATYAFINTYGEREAKNTIFTSLAPGSTITTDYPTVARGSVPNMSVSQQAPIHNAAGEVNITYPYTLPKNGTNESTSYVVTMFSNTSMEQLNGSYDYIIINKYALERGMIFYGAGVDQSYGWQVDAGGVLTALSQHNKLFDSNILALYN